jgi:hypothetical protein
MVSSPARHELRGKLGRGRRETAPPLARAATGRAADTARHRRARPSGILLTRRCALLCRSRRPRGRRLADAARWLAAARNQRAVVLFAAAGRIGADAVFVDVSANIGTETDYAPHSGRLGRAVAFEPEPYNAELLAMKLKASGLATARSSTQRRPVPQVGALSSTSFRATREHTRSVSRRGSMAAIVSRFRWCGSTKRSASLGLMPRRSGSCGSTSRAVNRKYWRGWPLVPVAFQFTPERYDAASKARLVERFAAHCTRMHRLGGAAGTAAPVLTLASIDTIDDVLVY